MVGEREDLELALFALCRANTLHSLRYIHSVLTVVNNVLRFNSVFALVS
jgi:hypothetical protein